MFQVLHIEVRMFAALRNSDFNCKREIISSLYKLELIIKMDPTDRKEHHLLNIRGADLNGTQFSDSATVSCNLQNINLTGVMQGTQHLLTVFPRTVVSLVACYDNHHLLVQDFLEPCFGILTQRKLILTKLTCLKLILKELHYREPISTMLK
jgi:uncharacterized protein YjbI with pentapeptide repeats